MTTGTLALIITTLLIAQAGSLLLLGYYRRWQQQRPRIAIGIRQPDTGQSSQAITTGIQKEQAGKRAGSRMTHRRRAIERPASASSASRKRNPN